MKILIAADLVPTAQNANKFKSEKLLEQMDKNFQNIWKQADYRIFNLECPLGEGLREIDKHGVRLIVASESIKGIKSLKPDLVLLANNHIMDFGKEGIENTINLLEKYNIPYTGLANNCKDKFTAYYIETDDIKVGIYNVCENEFSIATRDTVGANPLNEIKNCKEIQEAKKECDYLIVTYHGGKEYYRYPSPNLQRICRGFIDFGADVVITQHSHCIGCKEEYNGGTIVYGQGNFIFDKGISNEFWNTSLIISLNVEKKGITIDYIPMEKNEGLSKVSNNSTILKDFLERSEQIKNNEQFIEDEYNKFAKRHLNSYLSTINKNRFYKKILNKIFCRKYFLKTYNKKDCLKILNIIECEAHRELFIQGLKRKIGMGNIDE